MEKEFSPTEEKRMFSSTMENEETLDFQLEMKEVKPPLKQTKTNTKN